MNAYTIPGLMSSPTIDEIISDVFEVSPDQMGSRSRIQEVCDARHFAMYYRRKVQKETTRRAGERYNRDHATAIWAAGTEKKPGKVENMIQTDKEYRRKAEKALNRLKIFENINED